MSAAAMHYLRSLLTLVVVLQLAAACGRGGGNPDAGPGTDGPVTPDAADTPDADVGTPDGGEPAAVVVCDDPVPPASGGGCEVTGGAGPALLLRGTVLADGTVYEHGSVLVSGGEIQCVGCDCADATARVISCGGQVISPGLINPHDHMTYSEGWPIGHGTTRWEHRHGWRGSLSTPQNPHGTGATSSGNRWVEVRMLMGGATSMIGSGSATGGIRNLDRVEAADTALGLQEVEFETFPLGDSNETFHASCAWSYRFTELEAAAFPAYLPHIAEGINDYAAEEFRCQSTSMVGGQDYTEKNAAHIHSIGLHAADYWNMARDRATLIWSARSNIDLYGTTAQVALFHRVGGRIALGTDWSYSGSANMLRELACADQWNRDRLAGYFTDEQLWQMATKNAAHAAGADGKLGVLAAGAIADITVFAADVGEHHRAVVAAGNADVLLVLSAGTPLLGQADVITALGTTGCSPIDLCGSARSICLGSWGTFDALSTAVTGAYPAFFCGDPDNEPTCLPSRPSQYTGELTATDGDGDGIADASDLCPMVFDPIRPIDGGAQPDDDGDSLGDACDPTPLAIDIDGDTVANTADNCPFTTNQGQADADGDDKGDACDACPDQPNPDSVCPAPDPLDTTIMNVQNGTVATGTLVAISGVVVTGVASSEIWVQDPAGGPYSGLHVYKGSAPGVVVGDLVNLTGTVAEYFGDTELAGATITKVGTATPIVPQPLTVAEAMTEPYEGVLVELTDAVMGVYPYNCSGDNPACSDADLWTVTSGTNAIIVYKKLYPAADWTTHVGQLPVSGVMTWRYDRRRIMPRTAADFL